MGEIYIERKRKKNENLGSPEESGRGKENPAKVLDIWRVQLQGRVTLL